MDKKNYVYLVYKQYGLTSWEIAKVFKEEIDAKKFCDDQNEVNKPEFDDFGFYEGVYHTYVRMGVE